MVEQRRTKRFEIRLPVKLVRNGMRPISGLGETRNLSSGGVLFATDTRIDLGESIEYVIALSPTDVDNPVELHCLGKVTRLEAPPAEPEDAARPFTIAATLERYEFVRQRA